MESKSLLRMKNYFLICNHFLADDTSQASRYSIAIIVESVQMNYTASVLSFKFKTRHITHIFAYHFYSLRLPLVRCKFYSINYFPQTTALCDWLQEDVFLIAVILTCASLVCYPLSSTHIRRSGASYTLTIYLEPSSLFLTQGKQFLK